MIVLLVLIIGLILWIIFALDTNRKEWNPHDWRKGGDS